MLIQKIYNFFIKISRAAERLFFRLILKYLFVILKALSKKHIHAPLHVYGIRGAVKFKEIWEINEYIWLS
jgi:hypothetical protein